MPAWGSLVRRGMRLDVSTTLRSAQHDGIKDLYRDKVSNCHPEMGLNTRPTKDLAVRRILQHILKRIAVLTACIYTAKHKVNRKPILAG